MRLLKKIIAKTKDYENSHPKATNRALAISVAALMSMLGYVTYINHLTKQSIAELKNHQALYGTIENPSYIIDTDQKIIFPTLEDELRKAHPQYAKLDEISADLEKHESKLEMYRMALANKPEASITSKFRLKFFEDSTLANAFDIILPTQIPFDFFKSDKALVMLRKSVTELDNISSQVSKYGDIIQNGNSLFRELTGKPIPKTLEVQIKKIEQEHDAMDIVQGYHASGSDEVVFDDKGYEVSLMVYLHELGHVCFQGTEARRYNNLTSKKPSNFEEVGIMEESAAYLFMFAGITELKQKYPELGQCLESFALADRYSFVKQYKEGSDEEHRKGFALASALLAHFGGDVKLAFNYLSTRNQLNQLDPEIVKSYNDYRD